MADDQRTRYAKAPETSEPLRLLPMARFDDHGADLRSDRRSFLKAAGFSFGAAVAGACQQAPIEKAIPWLNQPEHVTPGVTLRYASTCGACEAACGLLVSCRDGRPIKLEGNPEHPLSQGGLCAVGQASILGLYDSQRLRGPMRRGETVDWQQADADIVARLARVKDEGGAVRVLTGTVISPTLRQLIARVVAEYPDARHVAYDALSSSAILEAHLRTHGRRCLPHYRFDRADVIVSLGADFLGTWIAPVEFTHGYRQGRSLEGMPPRCSYHVQFESTHTVTGGKADRRLRIAPAEVGPVLSAIAARIASRAGVAFDAGPADASVDGATLDAVAGRLWAARDRGLVVSGSQDVAAQVLCNFINHLLGAYGSTLDVDAPSGQRQGNDVDLETLRAELDAGSVAVLLIWGANPAYDLAGLGFDRLIARVPLSVSLAPTLDETAGVVTHVCPDHHYLESWRDAAPVSGVWSLGQPVIEPFGNTRAAIESLSTWLGAPAPMLDLVRAFWETEIFASTDDGAGEAAEADVGAFWRTAVQRGVVTTGPQVEPPSVFDVSVVKTVVSERATSDLAVVLYPKVGILDGRHADNPWLQELPDPVSKVTWDNYASLSPRAAESLIVSQGDLVAITVPGLDETVTLPVHVQPGQHDAVVAVALGYGRVGTERFAAQGRQWIGARPGVGPNGRVGTSVAAWLELSAGALRYDTRRATLQRVPGRRELAATQLHHTITVPEHLRPSSGDDRLIVRETVVTRLGEPNVSDAAHPSADLWPDDHPSAGHRWGMVIDLASCTGCSACVVACQVENNVPVVGYDEVRRQREMHWLRIDRYYSAFDGDVDVVHQPMMCQHCEHAPCETVCPVLATVHSAEGLNEQIYNRCVGTRYCANNCPYKVRRFNWFDYPHEDPYENLVLNPDVTVRSRGVMEKCTMCVQRIEVGKIEAGQRGEALRDGDITTACQQSCPAQAITFGDLNDSDSRVARLAGSGRYYRVLGDLNIQPAVGYLDVVRNRAPSTSADGDDG